MREDTTIKKRLQTTGEDEYEYNDEGGRGWGHNNQNEHQQKTTMTTDIDAGEQRMQWMMTGDNNDDDGQMNNDNFDN